jgi:hypothetical protein
MLRTAFFYVCLVAVLVFSCKTPNQNDDTPEQVDDATEQNDDTPEQVDERATVRFFNESSYQVDIYKNLNPAYFDPTTLVCTVNDGSTVSVKMYASADQLIGDTFFPRYKALFPDSMDIGRNLRVDAKRDLSNITFVVEQGKSYIKTIPQPPAGELQLVNGYLKVQNKGSLQIQIIRGDEILSRLDNGAVHLPSGALGVYEIQFSPFDDTLPVTQLKAFSSITLDFPVFSMERGKLYSFTVDGNTILGPEVTQLGVR